MYSFLIQKEAPRPIYSCELDEIFQMCFLAELSVCLLVKLSNKWDKVFKNRLSKICGRQPLKNLKGYGLLEPDHTPPSFLKAGLTNFTWSILEYFIPNALKSTVFEMSYQNQSHVFIVQGTDAVVLSITLFFKFIS